MWELKKKKKKNTESFLYITVNYFMLREPEISAVNRLHILIHSLIFIPQKYL
jgi:hypothetical protein